MQSISNIFESHLVSWQGLPPRGTIFGESENMKGLWQIVERVAGASVPILILGEEGTGKEVLARFIHCFNPGPGAPFMKVSPSIPAADAFDETALRVQKEDVEEGDFGRNENAPFRLCTLFVEEVADVGPSRQLELLQLIQGSRSFISGNGTDNRITLRVIGASTHDLGQEVAAGKFREDLFSFLSVVTLRLSPLRERKEDIPQLANYFWQVYSERYGCHPEPPSPELIGFLQEHDWPGNIRELENVMKRYVVLGAEAAMTLEHSSQVQEPVSPETAADHTISLKEATREAVHALERKIILRTLQETQWNRRRTARALNISYRALLYKIKEAGLISQQPKTAVVDSARHDQKSRHDVV
ncbi:MAG: sigma 54-interacting transcriptional regulator [Acidobacteriota bacterium]